MSRSAPAAPVAKPGLDMVEAAKRKLRKEIHAAFAHSIPSERYSKTLSYMLYDAACKQFRLHVHHDGVVSSNNEPKDAKGVRRRMMTLLMGLERVGLGQDNAQRALAHAMNKLFMLWV